jgi:hypothetical protein
MPSQVSAGSQSPIDGRQTIPCCTVQTPARGETLQASQSPRQGRSQQTPSAQLRLWHCSSAVHAEPWIFLEKHRPATQKLSPLQATPAPHWMQALTPQKLGAQEIAGGVAHAPWPSHVAAGWARPFVQLGAPHCT